jgi:hypothetical protein
MKDLWDGMLKFIKYALIMLAGALISTSLIVLNIIDVITIYNNILLTIATLIGMSFLMAIAIIFEIVIQDIIKWRKKKQ